MADCRKQLTDDCEDLLARFQKTESVRFEIFANIWREMKFSEIFHGTTGGTEGKAFSRQALIVACKYFLSPYTFQIRVGGLYLLYGLYSHQSARPKVQIQLALKDWEQVQKFEKDAAEAHHFDGVYILRKLFSQHAFCFAAMPCHLSYSLKKTQKKHSVCEEFIERPSRPQELLNSELLEELSNVHEHYERYRLSQDQVRPDQVHPDQVNPDQVNQVHPDQVHPDQVNQVRPDQVNQVRPDQVHPDQVNQVRPDQVNQVRPDQVGPDRVCPDLVRPDLVPLLRQTVMEFSSWQSKMETPAQAEEDSGEGSSQKESSRRAELLAAIKSRSYGQAVEASRGRRHRQVEVSRHTTPRAPRKPTLKSRADTILIQSDIKKETSKYTKVWRLTAPEAEADGEKTARDSREPTPPDQERPSGTSELGAKL